MLANQLECFGIKNIGRIDDIVLGRIRTEPGGQRPPDLASTDGINHHPASSQPVTAQGHRTCRNHPSGQPYTVW